MSAVGFVPPPQKELEELRSAYSSLNDIARNIAGVLQCLNRRVLKTAKAYLTTAQWPTEQAKKSLATVGQSKATQAKESI